MLTANIDVDLSANSYEAAVVQYMEQYHVPPSVLIVGPKELFRAYEIMREAVQKVVIVCVPVFPAYNWILCGESDLFYSSGA